MKEKIGFYEWCGARARRHASDVSRAMDTHTKVRNAHTSANKK